MAVFPSSVIPSATPVGPGTASLQYSGVLAGPLVNAVAYCHPLPSLVSEITVNGSLDGTPWIQLIQSFYGESGVWQALTGHADGGTGMVGQGYAVRDAPGDRQRSYADRLGSGRDVRRSAWGTLRRDSGWQR